MSRNTIKKAFIITELPLYFAFLYLDITDRLPQTAAVFKYISILICAVMAIYEGAINLIDYKNKRSKDFLPGGLIALGLIFTAVSDRFLLFEEDILPGLVSFCVVQTIYLIAIIGPDIRKCVVLFIVRWGLGILGMIFLTGVAPDQRVLIVIVLFYGISFVGNIFHLLKENVSKRISQKCIFARPALFLTGMILFLMCDINVLIFNLRDYLSIESQSFDTFEKLASVLIWTFYLPAQVMIVSSARKIED